MTLRNLETSWKLKTSLVTHHSAKWLKFIFFTTNFLNIFTLVLFWKEQVSALVALLTYSAVTHFNLRQDTHNTKREQSFAVFLCPNSISYAGVIFQDNIPPYLLIICYYVLVLFDVTCPIEMKHNLRILYVRTVFWPYLFIFRLSWLNFLN